MALRLPFLSKGEPAAVCKIVEAMGAEDDAIAGRGNGVRIVAVLRPEAPGAGLRGGRALARSEGVVHVRGRNVSVPIHPLGDVALRVEGVERAAARRVARHEAVRAEGVHGDYGSGGTQFAGWLVAVEVEVPIIGSAIAVFSSAQAISNVVIDVVIAIVCDEPALRIIDSIIVAADESSVAVGVVIRVGVLVVGVVGMA